jgi:nucleotide-binding universal stress UspA family protein
MIKILVPTDFSSNAEHALAYAVNIAGEIGARLSILHVIQPPVTRKNLVYPMVMEELNKARQEASAKLTKKCKAISEEYEIACNFQVATGNIIEEISKAAESYNANLIIMGTKGSSGINRLLFGSNTAAVIEAVPCMVIAVPGQTGIFAPRKIVFATNYQDTDMETLKRLYSLCDLLKAELAIIHVTKEAHQSDRDLIEEFAKAVASETEGPQPYYYVVSNNDVAKGIQAFVESTGSHLVVLSMRKRTLVDKILNPSITKTLANQAKYPLLAVNP